MKDGIYGCMKNNKVLICTSWLSRTDSIEYSAIVNASRCYYKLSLSIYN